MAGAAVHIQLDNDSIYDSATIDSNSNVETVTSVSSAQASVFSTELAPGSSTTSFEPTASLSSSMHENVTYPDDTSITPPSHDLHANSK
jgi:hypothetical protein